MVLNNCVNQSIRLIIKGLFIFLIGLSLKSTAQPAYFIDGYHGGVYGHYPLGFTRFIVDQLKENPDWKINLEIEPETWDTILIKEPIALKELQQLFKDQPESGRIEFVNPAYGQSYMFNISGESIVRHFYYGIQKIKHYFPSAVFSTYSSEEPCFTSALPQILSSFGFEYASLKNPNTCWGGYTRAYGGEIINWIGPDGSTLRTSPRYSMEGFVLNSTWQTIGWSNSFPYIKEAFNYGIKHPVAMTFQDAGWKYGPWLKSQSANGYQPTKYTTWRNYFKKTTTETIGTDWHFSQEDVLVSLIWGSQILQQLAQEVRVSENKLVMSEKITSLSGIFQHQVWPKAAFDEAWRCLLLSQHHDCWIVPYNENRGKTWAEWVKIWTDSTNAICNNILKTGNQIQLNSTVGNPSFIKVYNTTGSVRNEFVQLPIGPNPKKLDWSIVNEKNELVPSQIIADENKVENKLIFKAKVPSIGFAGYQLIPEKSNSGSGTFVTVLNNGDVLMETDLYRIVLDKHRGGSFKSFILKTQHNRELIDENNNNRFNALRGNFYNDGGIHASSDNPATINVIENGPLMSKVEIKGEIASQAFTQIIILYAGVQRIDCNLTINWKMNIGIGSGFKQRGGLEAKEMRKPFYNDSLKLLALFPVNIQTGKIYKDAPFDVTESKLNNTFFTSWDSIKNNIILNWVDLYDAKNNVGLALFTDHTTNYTYGPDFPLGLNVQYSGSGLWGRSHTITGPTSINYAILPHSGKWDADSIATASVNWNEPLVAFFSTKAVGPEKSLVNVSGTGLQVTATYWEGEDLMIRLFNAEGDDTVKKIYVGVKADQMQLIELDGKVRNDLKILKEGSQYYVSFAIPRFGIRTIRIVHSKIIK